MLFVILSDGSIFQGHFPNRVEAKEALSYLEYSWAEWMGERLFPFG